MVVIRLARTGSKKNPFYHVVVADKRFPRDGRYIEKLGYFNPMARGQQDRLILNQERVDSWLTKGAEPSDRVKHLIKELKKHGEAATKAIQPTKAEFKKNQVEVAAKAQAAKAKAELAAAKQAEAAETEAPAVDNSTDADASANTDGDSSQDQ